MEEHQPRALVILASAQIDYQIKSLLEAFFWPRAAKKNDPDELLENDNPLSSFSSRIKICRRLGLLDDRLAEALHKLREIRNQAAHWLSFGVADAPLKDQLKHLKSLIVARRSYRLTVARFFSEPKLTEFESLQAVLLTLSVLRHERSSSCKWLHVRRVCSPSQVERATTADRRFRSLRKDGRRCAEQNLVGRRCHATLKMRAVSAS